ncbi:MAG: prohibitin family protein [Chitinophagaceae bacterium]|nr:prohibitin family protein [Chitinophagaceae bacterium]
MILIILGVIAFFASLTLRKMEQPLPRYSGVLRFVALGLVVLGFLTACVKQIDAGQIGVLSLFGKVQNSVLQSGLNIVNPLAEVAEVDVKTQNYTMSGVNDEGQKSGDDAIRVLTADGLEVIIDLSVLYRVLGSQAPNIIRETGLDFRDKIVRPITRTRIRDNAVYFTAIDLYSTKRDQFQTRIFTTIDADFKKRGLVLEQLLVRNITLPANVKTSIEEKIKAEQDAQKMEFVLQKEKQEAERKRVEAQGIADYQRIINIGLTDNQLQYEQIKALKEIATSANAKVVIMGNSKTPIIIDGKGN